MRQARRATLAAAAKYNRGGKELVGTGKDSTDELANGSSGDETMVRPRQREPVKRETPPVQLKPCFKTAPDATDVGVGSEISARSVHFEAKLIDLDNSLQNLAGSLLKPALPASATRPSVDGKPTAFVLIPNPRNETLKQANLEEAEDPIVAMVRNLLTQQSAMEDLVARYDSLHSKGTSILKAMEQNHSLQLRCSKMEEQLRDHASAADQAFKAGIAAARAEHGQE